VGDQKHRPVHLPQQSLQRRDIFAQAGERNLRGPDTEAQLAQGSGDLVPTGRVGPGGMHVSTAVRFRYLVVVNVVSFRKLINSYAMAAVPLQAKNSTALGLLSGLKFIRSAHQVLNTRQRSELTRYDPVSVFGITSGLTLH
jgi:hypothetical protein